jgi:gliding motility-associated-like protein
MKFSITKTCLISVCFLLLGNRIFSQLQIVENQNAMALAQKLVGNGVIVSNATLTNAAVAVPTGFFYNLGGTNINIDSGIVITNGRAKSKFTLNQFGLDGDGSFPANNGAKRASTALNLPGDQDLADAAGTSFGALHDAVVLEFNVIPLGDTIQFRYCMSSEEYTTGTVCTFNDAFALLLSGPGITGKKNLAVVPGTSQPVTITNVNNIPAGCIHNPEYYIDNTTNVWLTHDGHTTVFTAKSEVQPCETYTLKFVIADRQDFIWDSGVFIEAGSLSSDPVRIDNQTPLNETGSPYVAEGCHNSSIHIARSAIKPYAQTVNLTIAGTATNGVDYQTINSSYTIPPNDSFVVIPIVPFADFITEGNETLKIYVSSGGCSATGVFLDSISIEIRDINMLSINPGDSVNVCHGGSQQLLAEGGYLNYGWTGGTGLNSNFIYNPIVVPFEPATMYICTATIGSCIARDSVLVKMKSISLLNKTDVFCHNGNNGQLTATNTNGELPVVYSINNQPYQSSNVFSNLPAGSYLIRMEDAANCVDSMTVTLVQSFPDLGLTAATLPATCSIAADGTINAAGFGGNNNYLYSLDGINYQVASGFTVNEGNYTVYVRDGNGCIEQTQETVSKINNLLLNAGVDTVICEGSSYTMAAAGNADSYSWAPAVSISNPAILNPVVTPPASTPFFITAILGTCTKKDTVLINVRAAPVANAGPDTSFCIGKSIQLGGSGGVSYQWFPTTYFTTVSNIAAPVTLPQQTISYYLTVKDIYQCQSLKPDTVSLNVTPTVKLFAGRDTSVAIGQPLQLNAKELNNSGVNQYSWSPSRYLSDAFIFNPIAKLQSDIVYTVTGKTAEGCQGTATIKIKVYQGPEIYVPGGFTPNRDGLNDVLKAIPVGMKEFHYFRIYNRWGQLIFSTQNPARGWDGTIGGVAQSSGTFVWMAEAVDYTGNPVFRKGTITLIR